MCESVCASVLVCAWVCESVCEMLVGILMYNGLLEIAVMIVGTLCRRPFFAFHKNKKMENLTLIRH